MDKYITKGEITPLRLSSAKIFMSCDTKNQTKHHEENYGGSAVAAGL
jgi:hypothetical protein